MTTEHCEGCGREAGDTLCLTEDRLRRLVAEGVEEAMTCLGVDAKDPMGMQRDFQYLRSLRTSMEAVGRKGLLTVVGVIVTGVCAVAWLGFKAMISH